MLNVASLLIVFPMYLPVLYDSGTLLMFSGPNVEITYSALYLNSFGYMCFSVSIFSTINNCDSITYSCDFKKLNS